VDDAICARISVAIDRMDKVVVVLGTVALATLALAIARQLSEKNI
jgi:hypothetical protein